MLCSPSATALDAVHFPNPSSMNALGFFVRRIAWQFGIRRERQRWGDVNRETQILSEAEDLLGKLAWVDVKEIEDLSGEYWQLVDLNEQQEKLREQTREADEKNTELQDELDAIQERCETKLQALRERKSRRMEDALGLMRDIEQLKDWKEGTKKKFMNLKAKLEVIQKHEGESADLGAEQERTRTAMAKLKDEFTGDITDIRAKTEEIEAIEKEVDELEAQIVAGKASLKEETATLSAEVSRYSKQVAELSARIGALENRKTDFYAQIGRYLSNNLGTRDPVVRGVLRRHRQLVGRIAYFRRSVAYNQRLARRTLA